MRIAVVTDIHANRHAFEAVLKDIDRSDAEELWCLGDLVGYGAEPDACVLLAREHAAVCLVGNHDMAVRGDLPLEDFSRGAAIAAQWTKETISPETLEYLNGLKPTGVARGVGLYHATRATRWGVRALLAARRPVPQRAARADLPRGALPRGALLLPRDGRGGQRPGPPRRRAHWTWRAASGWSTPARWDSPATATRAPPGFCSTPRGPSAEFRRTDYDIAGAAAAIRAARLPDSLAERLRYGQ